MATTPTRRRGRRRATPSGAARRLPPAVVLAAIASVVVGLALMLAHVAPWRTGTNGVWLTPEIPPLLVRAGTPVCQDGELLPRGTAALRIPVRSARQDVTLTLTRGGRLLDRVAGVVDAGRGARHAVLRARIAPPAQDLDGVEVCFTAGAPIVILTGAPPPGTGIARVGGAPIGTSIPIDYLALGRSSWWSHAGTVLDRMGLGRGDWGGGWTVALIAALLALSLGLTAVVVVRAILAERRVRALAVTVAAVAFLNAAAWSFVTPAFQVPDEIAHVAYAQHIGETGGPPRNPHHAVLSPEQTAVMAASRFGAAHAPTVETSVWSPLQQRRLDATLHAGVSPVATAATGRDIGDVEPEPPLYYALEAIPYRLARGATLLDRIASMRLLSALMAGATALCAFLFVRECLPRRPWAWPVGGLAVAFTPMLGFISGGVNPDALLFAISAALFLCLARAFRHGVDARLVVAVGALLAAGSLAKVNFAGLVPGVLLGLALAARRTEGAWNGAVARALGLAIALGAAPFALVSALEAVAWGRPFAIGRPRAPESHVGLLAHLSYVWQIYLPRLPGQRRLFPNYPAYADLFQTFVGAFGWIVARFPPWAYRLAAVLFGLLGALAARTLVARRAVLRRRGAELLSYAAVVAVLLALVGVSADLRRDVFEVVQGRYLLPLLALFGALLALAARGGGARLGRAAGAAIVVLALGWTLFAQLTTIAFFYG